MGQSTRDEITFDELKTKEITIKLIKLAEWSSMLKNMHPIIVKQVIKEMDEVIDSRIREL